MRKKNLFLFSFILLNLISFVKAQESPLSTIFGGKGLVGGILDGVSYIIDRVMTQPFIPHVAVFLMVFAVIYFLSRKIFFKEARNPAIVFSIAIGLLALYPKWGVVDAVAGWSVTFLAIIMLLTLLFFGWTGWNILRGSQLEAAGGKARAAAGAYGAGAEATGARGREEEARRALRMGRREGEEVEERAELATHERRELRGGIGGQRVIRGVVGTAINAVERVLDVLGNIKEKNVRRMVTPPDRLRSLNQEINSLRDSLNIVRNNLYSAFPKRVMEINSAYAQLQNAYRQGNKDQIKNALIAGSNSVKGVLVEILQDLQRTP